MTGRDFSKKAIIKFAEDLDIDPEIVVGRLQCEGYINFHTFNELKKKYTWDQFLQSERE